MLAAAALALVVSIAFLGATARAQCDDSGIKCTETCVEQPEECPFGHGRPGLFCARALDHREKPGDGAKMIGRYNDGCVQSVQLVDALEEPPLPAHADRRVRGVNADDDTGKNPSHIEVKLQPDAEEPDVPVAAAALRALLCPEIGNETLGAAEAVERCARRTTALLCAAPGAANASVCAQLVVAAQRPHDGRVVETLPMAQFVHVWWTLPLMLQIIMITVVAGYALVGIIGCIRLVKDGGFVDGDATFTASSYKPSSANYAAGSGIPVGDESDDDGGEAAGSSDDNSSSSAENSSDAREDDEE